MIAAAKKKRTVDAPAKNGVPEKFRIRPEDAAQWVEWKQKFGMEFIEIASRLTKRAVSGQISLIDE